MVAKVWCKRSFFRDRIWLFLQHEAENYIGMCMCFYGLYVSSPDKYRNGRTHKES